MGLLLLLRIIALLQITINRIYWRHYDWSYTQKVIKIFYFIHEVVSFSGTVATITPVLSPIAKGRLEIDFKVPLSQKNVL